MPDIKPLVEALLKCADQFNKYAKSHFAKGTDDGQEKAEVNLVMAQMCTDAARKAMEEANITDVAEVADYRFKSLIKGEHYAYARGLLVSPVHLPKALDAMQADGFTLLSVFGATNGENVGFIFSRNLESVVEENKALKDAMTTFVTRVEAGEVRSSRTYAQFNKLLGRSQQRGG